MVANIRGYTPNYSFKLVNFDTPRWHTLEYANWNQLDSLLLSAGIAEIRGAWTYGTLYLVGDRVFDELEGTMFRCLVQHTSATSGTFAQDRAAHPTYWTLQSLGVPLFRGAWTATTTYALGDIVHVGIYAYYLCTNNHTSGASFPPDASNWVLVFDATPAVDATQASAADAADSATQSATSATNSATSATASANSAIESAAQASKLYGTSTTSVTIGLGGKTFTTQADKYFNVGKFIMVRANADPVDSWMWGQVASYSGTALVVNVIQSHGTATAASWIIDVSGAKGADGTGGGGSSSVTTSDTPPLAPNDGDMWWETDTGILYVYYDDGDSQQWVQAVGVPNTVGVVSVEGDQNFTEIQKAQGRENIYAAPFDALAYNGMQVNGGMDVSQERADNGITVWNTNQYIIDGWRGSMSSSITTGRVTFHQAGLVNEIPGIKKALQFVVTATQASLSAGDYIRFETAIEGYRFSRTGWGTSQAKPVTVGFWVRASVAATYRALIMNVTGAVMTGWFPFTITAAGAFQRVTITFPAQTTGTWNADNTTGAILIIEMTSTGTANILATMSGYATITGVIILPGIEAPTASQSALIMRPFDQELVTCMRYYERSYDYGVPNGAVTGIGAVCIAVRGGSASATAGLGVGFRFMQPKRAIPTITIYDKDGAVGKMTINNGPTQVATANIVAPGIYGVQGIYTLTATGFVPGDAVEQLFHYIADARL